MKRTFDFGCIDFEGKGTARNRVTVEMEYKQDGDKKRFSVSANIWNTRHSDIVCGGQCLDTIAPYMNNNPVFSEILRLWELYHLNDMHPECGHPEGLLSRACPVCGYKYGTSWIYFPIPADDEKIIYKLLKTGTFDGIL